jgi:ribonuclease E
MKKAILISRDGGETRACLLQSGKLINVDAEGPSGASIIGNIYKGRIADIHRGLNAAFVDVGEGKEGFLSIQDIHPAILEQYDRRPHMNDIFKRGQEILVQVLRDPVGDKGAMLTTCISLPGRYVVLMPASENSGISKKLPEEERARLREIVDKVEVPDGFGIIVRTAGSGHTKQEINRDLNQLIKLWNQIEKVYGESKAPSLVVQEQSVAIRFLRDYLTTDMAEIVVDHEETHKEVSRFLNLVMPRVKKQLSLYTDQLPLFIRYGVEAQLEKMFLRDVPLPSGGRIVIDTTEALIAVDVNSGRHKEKNVEETALRANLEAAEEIASQIMLRDLGGLLVIDFIDMYQAKNRTAVQKMMRDCLKDDKAKVSIGRISQFGLLEMTRQRLRSGIISRATEQCTQCKGVGYRRTTSSSGLHILRRIRELAAGGTADIIKVVCPVEVANFVQNSLRDLINTVEQERNIKVLIEGNPDVFAETLEQVRLTSEEKKGPDPVSAPVYGNHDVAEPKREEGVAKQEEAKQAETKQAETKQAETKQAKTKTEEPKKPRRSRRPRKKTDADKPATETAESQSAAKETKSAKDGEETPKKPRRSRRPRKKVDGDKPATEAAESKTAASKKKSEGDDGDAKPMSEAAKRRRRRGGRGRGGKPAANTQDNKATAAPEKAAPDKEVARPAAASSAAPPPIPSRDPYVYSPPPQAPAWDAANRYQPGQDSLLDKVLKKLLKLER